MTQIVGIICKEAIIIGSESQYTMGQDWKQFEQNKMDIVHFKDGSQLLVALAGAISPALAVIKMMKESAKERDLDSEFAGAALAKEAIAKYRRDVLDFYCQGQSPPPEAQDYIFGQGDRCFQLMVGYYHGLDRAKKPCLYKTDLYTGNVDRIHNYAVMGSGSHVATLMLSQFNVAEMTWGGAFALAVDTLERIKTDDLYCGGQVRIGMIDRILFKRARAGFMPDVTTNRVVDKLAALRRQNTEWLRSKLASVMEAIHNEDYEAMMKQMRIEEEQEAK